MSFNGNLNRDHHKVLIEIFYSENMLMQYKEIFQVVKNGNFQ